MPTLVFSQDSSDSEAVREFRLGIPGDASGRDAYRIAGELFKNGTESLSSLTRDERRQELVPSPGELFSQAPNATMFDGGGNSFGNIFGVRGINNSLQFSSPSISLYLDGVPLIRTRQYPTRLLDPTSIQIFRGPQVTNSGIAGEAGMLRIETSEPWELWNGSVTSSYGSYETQEDVVLLGGPLGNGWFGQFGGFYGQSDGFVENPLDDTTLDHWKAFGGQAKILWRPSKNAEIALLFWREDSDGASRLVPLSSNPFQYATDFPGESQTSNTIGALRFRHSEEDWELSAVVTGQWWKLDPYNFDIDFSGAPMATMNIPMNEEAWIGEITAASKGDIWTEFTWRTGFSGSWDAWHFKNERNVLAGGFQDSSSQSVETQNVSWYGMAGMPFAERFRAWIGARVTWSWEQSNQQYDGPIAPTDRFSGDTTTFLALPDAGVEFRYDDQTLFYAKCGGGGKPGGFTPFFAGNQLASYESELLINGEIGLKRSWLSNRITLQASAFYYSVEDYQFESANSTGGYLIYNVPEAAGYGGEIECIASPIKGLELGLGCGVTQTKIQSGNDPVTAQSVEGNRLPYAPSFTTTGTVAWRPYQGWVIFAEGVAVGSSYSTLDNSAQFKQSTYATLNLKIGYEWEHASVYFVGNNVTDTEFYSLITPNLGAGGSGVPGEPQNFGARVSLRY